MASMTTGRLHTISLASALLLVLGWGCWIDSARAGGKKEKKPEPQQARKHEEEQARKQQAELERRLKAEQERIRREEQARIHQLEQARSRELQQVRKLEAEEVRERQLQQATGRHSQQGKARQPQQLSNAELHEALHILQATRSTLQRADHDYGGHRKAAVNAIGAAEHQLRLALGGHHHPGGRPVQPGKGGGNKEPQAVSNMQLAQAIPVLERTETFLNKANHDYGGHRAAAVRDLGHAVGQLRLALAFEKK